MLGQVGMKAVFCLQKKNEEKSFFERIYGTSKTTNFSQTYGQTK